MNSDSSNSTFLGKASLVVLLCGIGLWGLGFVTGYVDAAMALLLLSLLIAFGLGVQSRKTAIGKTSMFISGSLLILGVVNYVIFLALSEASEEDYRQQGKEIQADGR